VFAPTRRVPNLFFNLIFYILLIINYKGMNKKEKKKKKKKKKIIKIKRIKIKNY